jgi:hypothetical protein
MPAANKAATAIMISFLNFMVLPLLVALRSWIIRKNPSFTLPGESCQMSCAREISIKICFLY